MARLGADRGPELRVRQTNVDNGEVFVVSEEDFINGAYDPEHFDIVSYADARMVPLKMPDSDDLVVDENTGAPVMVREYREISSGDKTRIVREAKAERTQAHRDAKALNPQGGTDPNAEE